MARRDNEGYSLALMALGTVLVMYTTYVHGYGLFRGLGLTDRYVDLVIASIRHSGLRGPVFIEKALSLFLFVTGMFLRSASSESRVSLPQSAAVAVLGLLLLFIPHIGIDMVFVMTTALGFVTSCIGLSLLWKHLRRSSLADDPLGDTFRQCERKLEDRYSINMPMRYQWQGRMRDGWINVVNPFRGTLILGTPGSGKSYSVYGPYIEQMVRKGYSMFVYDYKYPDLTKIVYNELCADGMAGYPVKPKFYTIDFNDPVHSHRCNPIAARYITDPADSAEIAEVIMLNIAPGKEQKNDFFDMSGKSYIDANINYLSRYEGGRYCTFAHMIELACRNYKDVMRILAADPMLEVKMAPFISAMEGGAQDQLQGQIASATIPLTKFSSPDLYWVLTGDDFTLDINEPDSPKIVCVGNDPKRQAIYGTTLALIVARLCKSVNEKGKIQSGVLLDELPTIFVKGLDNLIATARSNKVAVVLGAQDKSQLIRDYGQKESDVIFNTVGNIFAGQVNGKTAEELSKSFGKEFRERRSQSLSSDSESETLSKQLEDKLPVSRIESLSPGVFCGKVQDSVELPNEYKFFCAKIQRPPSSGHDYWKDRGPTREFEGQWRDEVQANYLQVKADVDMIIRLSAERYGIELEEDRQIRLAAEKAREKQP